MSKVLSSTLLLTLLLAIGLVFFLRAASKDRTTVVDVFSSKPPIEVLDGISLWLEGRGWIRDGGDLEKKLLRFRGSVSSSNGLAILLSIYGMVGSACLGLVLVQLYPFLGWWPLLLSALGPVAGAFYQRKASRIEAVELRLISSPESDNSQLRVRAHRDELIAMELELSNSLALASDGSLLSSPI
ncbi:cofactor assembly of complex C subunit B [Prochlorococcus sp. MIT 1341]|uniref:cofactor assembly of complex C subunit B n=1 Tax=Prochlorococcus sp. MIT 1341 TaxID=3096221 RepID=UPI002A752955|nr:cofactor assembly of complex C subunit B [Prochlorococcus sp. MIT 1341]